MRPLLQAERLLLALLAAAGSLTPCFASGSTGLEAAHERLGALQARIRKAMDGADFQRSNLQALAREYSTQERLRAAENERRGLRTQLRDRSETIRSVSQEFEVMVKTYNTQVAVSGLSRMWDVKAGGKGGKGELEMEAGAELSRVVQYDSFRKEYSSLNREIQISLAEDETAYHAALSAFAEARRYRWMWYCGGLAAAALGLAAALSRRRRGQSAPSPVSGPVLSPESGPVDARISGPAAGALPGAADSLAPGTILGQNYSIERELGRGGMGVVYEALDLSLRRKVAVKRMRSEISRRERDLERFLSEARLVAALRHPNIVEIHAVLREEREVYLVFERVEGSALDRILAAQGRLPVPAALDIARRVAAALDYAHAQRVIHRDLKPANIMVSPGGALKVMDFGLAHQASQTVARLTKAESWGTPPYMAPEQEVGEVSRASDVFSLGVCAYEMLAGKLPFNGPDFLTEKRAGRPPPPSRWGAPPAFDAVLALALAPEPGRRYRSAGELAAALSGAISGGSLAT